MGEKAFLWTQNPPPARVCEFDSRSEHQEITKDLAHSRILCYVELSKKEILQRVKIILDAIEVHHREWSGGKTRKYSTIKTKVFAGRMPVDLLNEIHKFKGSNAYHLERALRLYVKVMEAKD